jgi:hypothetical protein
VVARDALTTSPDAAGAVEELEAERDPVSELVFEGKC